jgi:hypothetical protein
MAGWLQQTRAGKVGAVGMPVQPPVPPNPLLLVLPPRRQQQPASTDSAAHLLLFKRVIPGSEGVPLCWLPKAWFATAVHRPAPATKHGVVRLLLHTPAAANRGMAYSTV